MTNKNKESKDTSSDNKARSEESGKKRAIKTPSEENIDFSKRNTMEWLLFLGHFGIWAYSQNI